MTDHHLVQHAHADEANRQHEPIQGNEQPPVTLSAERNAPAALMTGGIILTGLGLYFIFLRPTLLPEDPRYLGTSFGGTQNSIPGLLRWLPHVFGLTGGFACATGLLTCYIASAVVRNRAPCAAGIVAFTGLVSIGLTAVVNCIIASDFKWLIFSFTPMAGFAMALLEESWLTILLSVLTTNITAQ